VGKTAIVEGLAQRIVNGTAEGLKNKTISLDIGRFWPGRVQGQFEEVKAVLGGHGIEGDVLLQTRYTRSWRGAPKARSTRQHAEARLARELHCIGATTR
jgi:ATP-dependent Clp protease ATP-binding subunit ClpA